MTCGPSAFPGTLRGGSRGRRWTGPQDPEGCDVGTWLLAADLAALAAFGVAVLWLAATAADELRRPRPAAKRHPGHYGTREG